jgi:hypothetical protein
MHGDEIPVWQRCSGETLQVVRVERCAALSGSGQVSQTL